MTAWTQVIGGWLLLVFAWWLNGFDHANDGWDYPYVRLADRPTVVHGVAARIDPGIALAKREATP